MIMRSNSSDSEKDGQNNRRARRCFSKIRRAAKRHWDEFLNDLQAHTAKGLLSTAKGIAHTADLSFDDNEKRLSVAVQLRPTHTMTPSQLHTFLSLQNRNNFGSSFITFDEESQAFQVKSQAVVPNPETSDFIVTSVFSDILRILEDSNLNLLWN